MINRIVQSLFFAEKKHILYASALTLGRKSSTVVAVALLTILLNFVAVSRAAIATPLVAAPYFSASEQHLEPLQQGDRLLAEAIEVSDTDQGAPASPQQQQPDTLPPPTEESADSSGDTQPQQSSLGTELSEEAKPSADLNQIAESAEPLKTYFLNLISDHPRQQITLNPPARQIKVSVGGGANSVLCSDGAQTYTCASGKPLVITHESDKPITQFWAQNSGGGSARIRVAVYE